MNEAQTRLDKIDPKLSAQRNRPYCALSKNE
ncbi:hypothetical protein SAMN04487851_105116 [Prevotella sp. tc2-28]|nr:hypothetical protein SAMN04487851_105116 [Prevotella sp. tc2-28]